MQNEFQKSSFGDALLFAHGYGGDVKDISKAVPRIIDNKDALAAHMLVTTLSDNRDEWLPEALMLMGVEDKTQAQKNGMVHAVFGSEKFIAQDKVDNLLDLSARFGTLGFSFPTWRFVSQGFGEDKKAMLEHFGMERLKRDTDVRDSSLPFSNPERDEFGAGFKWKKDNVRIEYRRSYIAASLLDEDAPVTVIVRNNSHFYGRDRLPHPVLISYEAMDDQTLDNLSATDFENEGKFIPWQNVVSAKNELTLGERLGPIEDALGYFEGFDATLSLWLSGDYGLKHFKEFAKEQWAKQQEKGSDTPPLYVGFIKDGMPPWKPSGILAIKEEFMDMLDCDDFPMVVEQMLSPGRKMVLLSGNKGDFPVIEKAPAVGAAEANNQPSMN